MIWTEFPMTGVSSGNKLYEYVKAGVALDANRGIASVTPS